MDASTLLDRNRLLAIWRHLTATTEFGQREPYELDGRGELLMNSRLSARRQIVLTDVHCHLTEQMGHHLAAMSVPVTTPSFGIRVPDVVWVPGDRLESFENDDLVPFVPDLCAEVLLDSDRTQEIDRRVKSCLEGGAREAIVVSPRGQVEFWGTAGQRQASMFGVELSLDPTYSEERAWPSPAVFSVERMADAISSYRTPAELKRRHEASPKVGILHD
ncbi:Endonuclease, Uma2 family (restriction endonuclease fold) [Burkholderia sp. OK233]|nr:Endonuclease, Uma2 family (restriction endonuclease fold) [Burkholderia sp. OK233]